MKYKGRQLKGPRKKVIPVLRDESEGGNIYFIVQGVTDLQPFFDICPAPIPPKIKVPGGAIREDVEDKNYKIEMNLWWQRRSAWIAIKSLAATEELEWESVDLSNPETFKNYTTELTNSGLSDGELSRLLSEIMDVNGLNERQVEEARQSFLTTQDSRRNGQSSPKGAAVSTPSGEAVLKSESDHPDSKT